MSRSALQKLADPFFLDVAPDEAIEHPAWCEALAAARQARNTGVRTIAVVGDDGIGRSLLAATLRADGLAASTDPVEPDAADQTHATVAVRRATSEEIGVFLGRRLSAAGLSADLIDTEARRLIAEGADGSVAEASRIAGLALAEAGRAKARRVRPRHVRSHLPRPVGSRQSRRPWAAAVIAAAACCAVLPLRAGFLGTDHVTAHPDRTVVAARMPADLGTPIAAATREAVKQSLAPAPTRRVAADPRPVAPAPSAPARPTPPIVPAALSSPILAPPPDTPPPVLIALRFDLADPGSRNRASRLAKVLSALGAADVEPVGVRHLLPEAVGYRFGEDRGTALAVGRAMQALDDRTASVHRDRGAPGGSGPGMIDVSVGG